MAAKKRARRQFKYKNMHSGETGKNLITRVYRTRGKGTGTRVTGSASYHRRIIGDLGRSGEISKRSLASIKKRHAEGHRTLSGGG